MKRTAMQTNEKPRRKTGRMVKRGYYAVKQKMMQEGGRAMQVTGGTYKLKYGDRIGIVCCSNGQKRSDDGKLKRLESILLKMGLHASYSDCIYEKENGFSGTGQERARELMKFYRDDEIKGIFDISGGDIANGILPYLDYDIIADSGKLFWGYSDLTTVINAIYAKTGKASVLYQVRNLLYGYAEGGAGQSTGKRLSGHEQIADSRGVILFRNTVINGSDDLFRIHYRFLQQKEMQGTVIGGNIRCFLKLAGTEYMPDLDGRILLLEAFHGMPPQIETYLRQLQQLGAFERAAGILLGTFTQMEAEKCTPTVETLIREIVGKDLPIAVTADIGHGTDSKAIIIGQELHLMEGA